MDGHSQRIDELRTLIIHHDERYHEADAPEIPDADYDALYAEGLRAGRHLTLAHDPCPAVDSLTDSYATGPGLDVAWPDAPTPDELLEEIAGILKFDVEALKGKSRQRPLVTARQEAMYVFRELTDLSYPAIARLFGGRDHTTVIHANEKIQRLMKERKQVYDQLKAD